MKPSRRTCEAQAYQPLAHPALDLPFSPRAPRRFGQVGTGKRCERRQAAQVEGATAESRNGEAWGVLARCSSTYKWIYNHSVRSVRGVIPTYGVTTCYYRGRNCTKYPVCFSLSRNEEDYGWLWLILVQRRSHLRCIRGNLFLDKARCFKGMSFPLQSFDLLGSWAALGWANKTQVPSGFDNWVPVQNPMGNHHCSHFNGQTQTATSHQRTLFSRIPQKAKKTMWATQSQIWVCLIFLGGKKISWIYHHVLYWSCHFGVYHGIPSILRIFGCFLPLNFSSTALRCLWLRCHEVLGLETQLIPVIPRKKCSAIAASLRAGTCWYHLIPRFQLHGMPMSPSPGRNSELSGLPNSRISSIETTPSTVLRSWACHSSVEVAQSGFSIHTKSSLPRKLTYFPYENHQNMIFQDFQYFTTWSSPAPARSLRSLLCFAKGLLHPLAMHHFCLSFFLFFQLLCFFFLLHVLPNP